MKAHDVRRVINPLTGQETNRSVITISTKLKGVDQFIFFPNDDKLGEHLVKHFKEQRDIENWEGVFKHLKIRGEPTLADWTPYLQITFAALESNVLHPVVFKGACKSAYVSLLGVRVGTAFKAENLAPCEPGFEMILSCHRRDKKGSKWNTYLGRPGSNNCYAHFMSLLDLTRESLEVFECDCGTKKLEDPQYWRQAFDACVATLKSRLK